MKIVAYSWKKSQPRKVRGKYRVFVPVNLRYSKIFANLFIYKKCVLGLRNLKLKILKKLLKKLNNFLLKFLSGLKYISTVFSCFINISHGAIFNFYK